MKSFSSKSLSFKSFNGYKTNILYNKYILYIFLTISVLDLFYLTSIEDYTSVSIFIICAFLISFFNKNMIVILFITLVVTHILKSGANISYEGMKTKKDEEDEEDEEDEQNSSEGMKTKKDDDDSSEYVKGTSLSNDKFVDNLKNDNSKKGDKYEGNSKKEVKISNYDSKKEKTTTAPNMKEVNSDMKEFYDLQQKIMKGLEDIDPLLSKAESFVDKMQNHK